MTNHPLCRAQCPAGKRVTAAGAVGHLNSLTHAAEQNRMVAYDIAGTDRLNPNFVSGSLSDQPFACIDTDLIQIPIDCVGENFGYLESRSAGRVFLETVMGFNHFNVVFVAERLGHFANDLVQQVHADAHVGGENAGDLPSKGFEFIEFCFSGANLPASVLLCAAMVYWSFMILVGLDLDILDFDLDFDAQPDFESAASLGLVVLRFLNIGRVPIMIWGSVFTITFWLTSTLMDRFLDQGLFEDPTQRWQWMYVLQFCVRNFAISMVLTSFSPAFFW